MSNKLIKPITRVLLLGLSLACMFSFKIANAESYKNYQKGSYYFAPSVGYYNYSDKRNLDSSSIPGLTLGYAQNEKLSFDLYLGRASADSSDTGSGQSFYAYWLDGVYHFNNNLDNFRPYALAGIGVTNQDDDQVSGNSTLLSINAGAGLEYFVNSNISFFSDLRDIYSPSGGKNDWMANFGIKFMFEASKPPIAASDTAAVQPAETRGTTGFYELQENAGNAFNAS